MNREIKFRAWTSRKMLYPQFPKEGYINVPLEFIKDSLVAEPQAIYMQYTGLKDKNGVEIYEGDVIHWQNKYFNLNNPSRVNMGFVKFDEKFAGFAIFNNYDDDWADNADWYGAIFELEVIGNIYENPELLK